MYDTTGGVGYGTVEGYDNEGYRVMGIVASMAQKRVMKQWMLSDYGTVANATRWGVMTMEDGALWHSGEWYSRGV